MTTRSSFDDMSPVSSPNPEIATASNGSDEQLILPRPEAPTGTLANPHEVSPEVGRVQRAGSVESRRAWILLVAVLPIALITWVLTLLVLYGFVHQGEGTGSDTERLVMNMILFTSILVPTFLGAIFGALGWRRSRRISPAIAAALNALLASLMIGMIVGYTDTPPLVASIGMGLVLMVIVVLGVARPWRQREQDEGA